MAFTQRIALGFAAAQPSSPYPHSLRQIGVAMTDIVEELRDLKPETPVLTILDRCIRSADEIERLRAALAPFAGDKMPSLRKSEIDYDRHGWRRCMSPMEIACRDAFRALCSPDETLVENAQVGQSNFDATSVIPKNRNGE